MTFLASIFDASNLRILCLFFELWPISKSEKTENDGSYSRSRYELENKCVIHFGCVVVVVWSLVELFVEFDCCVNCSVAWLVAVRKFL